MVDGSREGLDQIGTNKPVPVSLGPRDELLAVAAPVDDDYWLVGHPVQSRCSKR